MDIIPEQNPKKRMPPVNEDAEKCVVGAALINPETLIQASEYVNGNTFFNKAYGQIFEIMLDLYNAGKAVDSVTVINRMREINMPDDMCTEEFLAELAACVPFSANASHYARIVAEKSTLRRLITTCGDIASKCYEQKETLPDILDAAERGVFEVIQRGQTSEYEPVPKVIARVLNRIEEASRSDGSVTGIASGFTDLDYKTSGFQDSDLILLAARPSMGKTAFALNIAQNVAKNDKAVVVFSLEMPREQLIQRMLATESHVSGEVLRNGSLNDMEWMDLVSGAQRLGKTALIIDDTPDLTISTMRSKCRKYKIDHDISLIILDYLQLMNSSGRSESRQNEISEISRSLKALARELNVPVIALSQLNRSVERRDDKRPMLSDLRESGAIEQDADVVMFLYRDDYYNKDSEEKGVTEVIIAKQRNGPVGTVRLAWLAQYLQFGNLARPQDAQSSEGY